MPTRYFPVSVAVPLHLDKVSDKEIRDKINHALAFDSIGEPLVVVELTPEQFVVTHEKASADISDARSKFDLVEFVHGGKKRRGKKARR